MATLLLKKSYLHKNLKEVRFNNLWRNIKIITKDIDRYQKSILLDPKLIKETYY